MPLMPTAWPARRGALLALLAAVLFGFSTPLVQRWGAGLGAFSTAALLYAGAAAAGGLLRQSSHVEAPLRRRDLPRLLAMALFGSVLAPVALAWGLQRSSGSAASLMLTLEALFTAVLAWWWYGEVLGRRVWAALALLLAGAVLLVLDGVSVGPTGVSTGSLNFGLLAVLAATAAWGVDNSLSRALAERDPGQVVLVKASLGAAMSLGAALVLGEPLPAAGAAAGLVAVGAVGYGVSLRFYLLAQRAFGAARTGSVFAFAPFIGAAGALALGDRSGGLLLLCAGALMAAGVLLHLAEAHAHAHTHEAMAHEHAHRHDDGHHLYGQAHGHGREDHRGHDDDPASSTQASHSHPHQHTPLQHSHPHVPDAHHQHRH